MAVRLFSFENLLQFFVGEVKGLHDGLAAHRPILIQLAQDGSTGMGKPLGIAVLVEGTDIAFLGTDPPVDAAEQAV